MFTSMRFAHIMLAFPLVLGVHNIDEYRRYDAFVESLPFGLRRRVGRDAGATALIFLTVASAVLAGATRRYRTPALYGLARIAVFALAVNAAGHIARSVRRGTIMPGTPSAVAVVVPFSVLAVVTMHADLGDSARDLLRYALLGAGAMPLAAGGFLFAGIAGVRTARALGFIDNGPSSAEDRS